jgi:hypothetical protein
MEEIDPHIFLDIGMDMTIGHIKKENMLEEHCQRKYIKQIEKDIELHISELNNIKNNINEITKKQKKINIYKSNKNRNSIESEKYYYYTITIDKLKDEQKLLESNLDKLKIIYKSINNN